MSMDALRLLSMILTLLACMNCMNAPARGAHARSINFRVIAAPSAAFARQVVEAAEKYRYDLAVEWLGSPLPDWPEPCPITVQAARDAGGETSFVFDRGVPSQWQMRVQGSAERILDSVLPHEVTHTIFATHFGQPLPRWADEGACTTVEHESERAKQQRLLVEFLTTERGIPFRHMYAMREYPTDILPLYSQGYSLARFLIAQGGKPKFIDYVGDGMQVGDWHSVTAHHYGYKNLGELQLAWLAWVKQGSPDDIPTPTEGDHAAPPAASIAGISFEKRTHEANSHESESWYLLQSRQAGRLNLEAPPPRPLTIMR